MPEVRLATSVDAPLLARLRGMWDADRGTDVDAAGFADELADWMDEHAGSHLCALALEGDEPIGMAWLAIVERVPRPGRFARRSGDIQSVFVAAEWRKHGIGTLLMDVLTAESGRLGLSHESVHTSVAGSRLYERHGFELSPVLLLREDPTAEH